MTFSAMFFVNPKKRTKSLAEAVLILTGARAPLTGVTTGAESAEEAAFDPALGLDFDGDILGGVDTGALAVRSAFA